MNKAELDRRKAQMTARAKAEIAKSGIVQFRLEPANILKLYEASVHNKKPVGTMVREWVLERLNQPTQTHIVERLTKLEQQVRTLKGVRKQA